MTRAFIAIELPEYVKQQLLRIQDKLKTTGADVKWVEPKNIHLTLKFLGERDDKKIAQIRDGLGPALEGIGVYKASLASVGAFPDEQSPRVVWAGIEEGRDQTSRIAKRLEEAICLLGIPKEKRPFSCHITLGRTRSNLNLGKLSSAIIELRSQSLWENPGFDVESITLFKSTLSPQGPAYEALKAVNLKAS